jgi:hypothetical protein
MAMNEAWQKRTLVVAASWNVLGGISALLDPAQHFAQMYRGALDLGDPVQRFFFQSVWIAVIAWGAAYAGAALVPAARKVVLLAGGAGKLAYLAACVALFLEGTGKGALLAAGIADLVFAALFAIIVFGRSLAVTERKVAISAA